MLERGILTYNANALLYLLLNAVKELDDRTETIQELSQLLESASTNYSNVMNLYEDLSQQVAACCNSSEPSYKIGDSENDLQAGEVRNKGIFTVQPNPFSTETTISYSIETNFADAALTIVDSNGRQLYRIPIENPVGSVVLTSDDLVVGTYFCTLIVNGKNVGSKRIIHIK